VSAAASDLQMLRRGLAIGNRAVVDTIKEGVRVRLPDGGRWYDIRPLIDPREHCPESVDMAAEALSYAESAGLARRHSEYRHLLCILYCD
jgi:hypothetical protein